MNPQPDVAFVTVVEPNGTLESQVILLAESLRRWGGALAQAPLYCVSPRYRPPLSRRTWKAFDRLGVTYLDRRLPHRFSWYNLATKPLAMLLARSAASQKYLIWLDGDTMVIDEPEAFLAPEVDFLACSLYREVASSGPEDRYEPYWQALCRSVGLDLDDLPWTTTAVEGCPVRYYINSGVFLVRRDSPVLDHYLRNLERIWADGVASTTDGVYMSEQIALSLAVPGSGATWGPLPRDYNFMVSGIDALDNPEGLESARILHYRYALSSPDTRANLLRDLRERRPDRREWVEAQGLLSPNAHASPLQRVWRRSLRVYRNWQLGRYLRSCRYVDTAIKAPVGPGG